MQRQKRPCARPQRYDYNIFPHKLATSRNASTLTPGIAAHQFLQTTLVTFQRTTCCSFAVRYPIESPAPHHLIHCSKHNPQNLFSCFFVARNPYLQRFIASCESHSRSYSRSSATLLPPLQPPQQIHPLLTLFKVKQLPHLAQKPRLTFSFRLQRSSNLEEPRLKISTSLFV